VALPGASYDGGSAEAQICACQRVLTWRRSDSATNEIFYWGQEMSAYRNSEAFDYFKKAIEGDPKNYEIREFSWVYAVGG